MKKSLLVALLLLASSPAFACLVTTDSLSSCPVDPGGPLLPPPPGIPVDPGGPLIPHMPPAPPAAAVPPRMGGHGGPGASSSHRICTMFENDC